MSKWEVYKSELISLQVTVPLIVFPSLSQFIGFSKPQKCARHFLCLMFAVKKPWCEFLPGKKVARWSWSIRPCSAHRSPSPKVYRGTIPKSHFPYSFSDTLASPGTTEHRHHLYINSYNTPGKEGRENLLLLLPTWGWERLSWEQVVEARNQICVFRGSTCGSPSHPWKALPWPTIRIAPLKGWRWGEGWVKLCFIPPAKTWAWKTYRGLLGNAMLLASLGISKGHLPGSVWLITQEESHPLRGGWGATVKSMVSQQSHAWGSGSY